jgi:hypothetical protein
MILTSTKLYSQVNIGSLTGKKWKLDQFYTNKVRFNNQRSDSLRYEYMSNGIMRIYQSNKTDYAEMRYTITADSLIISNGSSMAFRYKLLYLNDKFLIYTNRYTDNAAKSEVEAEFRFIPLN